MSRPSAAVSTAVSASVPGAFAPYALTLPQGEALPLVGDSPHSGTTYPSDFRFAADFLDVRAGEDTYVHELWSQLPAHGGTLLAAEFPRSYIDPNREVEDIDPEMLDAPWPGPLNPGEKTRLGIGLIWRKANKSALYDRKLTPAEVQSRIERFHVPYHLALNAQIDAAYKKFGAVWHLNLHSMPGNSYESLQIKSDHPLADFVLGDRDGTTCSPEFLDVVATALRKCGYRVAINDPFKGVALIGRIGRPHENRHSMQIEVQRYLYMNEQNFERNDHFDELQADLVGVTKAVASYIQEKIA